MLKFTWHLDHFLVAGVMRIWESRNEVTTQRRIRKLDLLSSIQLHESARPAKTCLITKELSFYCAFLSTLKTTTIGDLIVPVEDNSGETWLGKDHFPRTELLVGLQASTFLPCIKQYSTLHVPYSHCAGQTKHRADSEEGESSWGWDGLRGKAAGTGEFSWNSPRHSGALAHSLFNLTPATAKNKFAPSRRYHTSPEWRLGDERGWGRSRW